MFVMVRQHLCQVNISTYIKYEHKVICDILEHLCGVFPAASSNQMIFSPSNLIRVSHSLYLVCGFTLVALISTT